MWPKRVTSLVLAAILVFFTLPNIKVSAEHPENRLEESWQHNGLVDEMGELLPGGIKALKTAVKTGAPNQYQVEIRVESLPEEGEGKTTLFLIDISIGSDTQQYQTLLKNLLPEILTPASGNRVGIATFNGNVNLPEKLYDYTQLTALLSQVHEITASGGSYLDRAVLESRQWLEGVGGADCNLVILSRGYASYSQKVSGVKSGIVCNDEHTVSSWRYTPEYKSLTERIGSGSTEKGGIGFGTDIPRAFCDAGKLHIPYPTTYPSYHADNALYEARLTKAAGIKIFGVSLGAAGNGLAVMKEIADIDFSDTAKAQEGLTSHLVGEGGNDFGSLILTDRLPPLLGVVTGSLSVNSGQLTVEDNNIVWGLSQKGTARYTLEWDVTDPAFEAERFSPLAQSTSLEYNSAGIPQQITLLQPEGRGFYNRVFIQAVEQAGEIGDAYELLNIYGVNRWKPGAIIELAAGKVQSPDGYLPEEEKYYINVPEIKEDVYFELSHTKENTESYHLIEKYNLVKNNKISTDIVSSTSDEKSFKLTPNIEHMISLLEEPREHLKLIYSKYNSGKLAADSTVDLTPEANLAEYYYTSVDESFKLNLRIYNNETEEHLGDKVLTLSAWEPLSVSVLEQNLNFEGDVDYKVEKTVPTITGEKYPFELEEIRVFCNITEEVKSLPYQISYRLCDSQGGWSGEEHIEDKTAEYPYFVVANQETLFAEYGEEYRLIKLESGGRSSSLQLVCDISDDNQIIAYYTVDDLRPPIDPEPENPDPPEPPNPGEDPEPEEPEKPGGEHPDPEEEYITVAVDSSAPGLAGISWQGSSSIPIDKATDLWEIFGEAKSGDKHLELVEAYINTDYAESVSLGESGEVVPRSAANIRTIQIFKGEKYTFHSGYYYEISLVYSLMEDGGNNTNVVGRRYQKTAASTKRGEAIDTDSVLVETKDSLVNKKKPISSPEDVTAKPEGYGVKLPSTGGQSGDGLKKIIVALVMLWFSDKHSYNNPLGDASFS